MTVYRIRRDLALLASLPIVVVTAATCLILVATDRPIMMALAGVYAAVAAVLAARTYRRVRRRTLTVSETGLTVQRDAYRIQAAWSTVVGVERKRRMGLVADELVLTGPDITVLDAAGRATRAGQKVPGHPAAQRIQVSLYDKNWRRGPIGARLAHQFGQPS